FAHLLRVTLIVEEDETADPVDVHLFSTNAVAFHAQVPADAIEEFWRRSATLGRRIFRDAKGISRLGNDGKGNRGRLPPVVSSLFSIRAAHFKRWYQRHAAVSKGQGADGARRRVVCYLLLVISLLEDAGDTPASAGFSRIKRRTSNIKRPVLQTYSNCPQAAGPGFVVAAIYGATRKIILLLEWSKNLPIDQHRSGKRREW